MKQELKDEAVAVIDKAIWIGLLDVTKRQTTIDSASKDIRGWSSVKSNLSEAQKTLASQFDKHARDGSLESLKTSDTESFKKLWRAKHEKEYSGKLPDNKKTSSQLPHSIAVSENVKSISIVASVQMSEAEKAFRGMKIYNEKLAQRQLEHAEIIGLRLGEYFKV